MTIGSCDPTFTPMLIRVSEAATLLSISRSQAYALVAAGELPHRRVGKSIRIRIHDLEDYINSAPAPEAGAPLSR